MESIIKLLDILAGGAGLDEAAKAAGYVSAAEAGRALRRLADSIGGSAIASASMGDSGRIGTKIERGGGAESIVVYVDGASRGNPGPSSAAAVAFLPSGERLISRASCIGTATNNIAEYRAVIEGLELASLLEAVDVVVRMDSELVMKQLTGRYRIKNETLRTLAEEVGRIAVRFGSVSYEKVTRSDNKIADRLANDALDGKTEDRDG